MQTNLRVKYETDNLDAHAAVLNILTNTLPYMVDNVEIDASSDVLAMILRKYAEKDANLYLLANIANDYATLMGLDVMTFLRECGLGGND